MDNGQPSDEWAQEQNEEYLDDDWTDSLGVSIENPIYENTFEDNNVAQQSLPSHEEAKKKQQKKQGKQKNVAHRGTNFSKEEDAVICSAFLHVSKDPLAGVNQRGGAYYKRVYDFFCENKPEHSTRSQIGIQKRWLLIQNKVSKFCAFKSRVDRRNESGKNEQDRIDDAVKMYEEKEPFHFLHCWKMLRNEPKWNDKLLELKNTPARNTQQPQGPCNPIGTQPSNENTTITRPEGRDSAKKRRYNEETASSGAAVEVLQQMHERNEKTEQKQDQQMQEILALKGNKMRLTEKIFDLQKHEMEVRNKLKEEQLSLTKQDIEARAKQSEAQLLTAEVGIMGADLDKLSPTVRAYYITMQRQIMEGRGIVIPHDNDGA